VVLEYINVFFPPFMSLISFSLNLPVNGLVLFELKLRSSGISVSFFFNRIFKPLKICGIPWPVLSGLARAFAI